MRKIFYMVALLAGFVFSGCEKAEYGGTEAQNVAGEWWVTYELESATGAGDWQDVYDLGHLLLSTYNTAANKSNEMWIDDNENFWPFKVKVTTSNPKAREFAVGGDRTDNVAIYKGDVYDIWVNVSDGEVLKNVGRSKSGVKTDSICFYVEFEDDPGSVYKVSGHRRTGFREDEY